MYWLTLEYDEKRRIRILQAGTIESWKPIKLFILKVKQVKGNYYWFRKSITKVILNID